jgi:hypothetical protein
MRDTLSYLAQRLTGPVPGIGWHRYRLVAVPRTGMPEMPRGWLVEPMSDVSIAEVDPVAVAWRLEQGMTCLGAWHDGRLAGVNFVTAGAFEEDEVPVRFVPPPGAGWDTGLYIRPEDRMGRAFAALWAGTADWLRGEGLDWSMSRIADYNAASWNAHARMGAHDIGRLSVLSIGATHRYWGGGRTMLLPHPDAL